MNVHFGLVGHSQKRGLFVLEFILVFYFKVWVGRKGQHLSDDFVDSESEVCVYDLDLHLLTFGKQEEEKASEEADSDESEESEKVISFLFFSFCTRGCLRVATRVQRQREAD